MHFFLGFEGMKAFEVKNSCAASSRIFRFVFLFSLAQTNTANVSHFAVTVNPELTPPPSPVFEEGGGTEIFEDTKEAMHPRQVSWLCSTNRV